MTKTIEEIKRVLFCHGETFSGGSLESCERIAREWSEYGFKPLQVTRWCDAGCWEPSIAAKLAGNGITPEFAFKNVNKDLIYKVCNGDMKFSELVSD